MVLRDKSPPKLCFDNPLYNTDGASKQGNDSKKELKMSKSVTIATESHKSVDPRASNISHEGFVSYMFSRSNSSSSHLNSPEVSLPTASLTPEGDFEEYIMENIRNRDFWSRRSRSNPFSRMRVSALVRTPSRTPNRLQVPSQYMEEPQAPTPPEELDEAEEEEAITSEMMLEAQREMQLREDITWLRKNLTEMSEADGGMFSLSSFLKTMQNKELLRRLFSLWDVSGEGVLPQDEWVDHLKCSSREVGAREWAELLEVLAYVVCGEDADVTEDLFTTILTSRGVLEKLFRLINKEGDGLVSRQEIMDFIANLTYARPRTGFTRENLEWLEQLFRQALGHKQELSFDDFKKIVHSRNSFFAERVFQIFDRDNSGTVSLSEFLDAMHQFAGKSPNDKIKFLFRVYDLDGDGLIQQSELQKVMKACMEENGMKFSDEQIEDLTLAMFEDADTQNTGAITYESLKAQLEKHDGLLENLSISIDRWLVPPNLRNDKVTVLKKVSKLRPYQISLPYLKNNYVYLIFLLIYIAINLGLFISRAIEFRDKGGLTIVARACGQCLNFNCMFVLVLMLRQCITYLRSLGASSFLPLDQHLYLHKLCGLLIFIFSVVHTIMHLINFAVYIEPDRDEGGMNEDGWTLAEWLLTMRPGQFGLIKGIANPTGVALIIILTVMVICSLPFVRKSGYFEVFYWTHLLYIAFWTLTIFHGPNFWKWFVAPGVIFLVERFHRTIRMRTGRGKTYISSGVLLPSKVIHLVIKRPIQFHFHPGDYVFINIPEIAKYEWHPFTISSAPEQDDVVWLHIRAVGQWTNRLYSYFEQEQQRCEKHRSELHPRDRGTSFIVADGTSFKTLIEDGQGEESLTPNRPQTPILAITQDPSEPNAGASGSRLVVENGISNQAFEPDTNGNGVAPETSGALTPEAPTAAPRNRDLLASKNQSSPNLIPDPTFSKKKLLKSCSVPDLDKRIKKREKNLIIRGAFRAASERRFNDRSVNQANLAATGSSPFQHHARKSLAMSFKYMRRKPTIITLDTPSEAEDNDDEEEEEEEEEEVKVEEVEKESQHKGKEKHKAGEIKVTIQEGVLHSSPDTKGSSVVTAEGQIHRKSQQEEMKQRRKSRQEERKVRRKSRLEEVIAEGGCAVGKPLMIYIDGPFGAPSSHIFRAQHAVLIATGIGVTPFASILQSIMHKYWKARYSCPKCSHSWTSDLPHSVMNLRKVDFFWINRDQRSFEWFVNLLSQLEIEQAEQGGVLERFLDMHMYITSALQKTDMKAVGLQLALDLLHEKEKRDLITGLKTRTNAGRPNWDKVFKQLKKQQKGKITVFYCGPPALGRSLRYKCDEYGFDFRKEIF